MSVESMGIALNHSRAKGTARLVLVGIANHDGDGGAWPSVRTLARYAGVEERNVQAAITRLVALGEVVRHKQAGGTHRTPEHLRPNLYEFKLRCPADCDGTAQHRTRQEALIDRVTLTSPGDAGITPPGDASITPPGDAGITRTVLTEPPSQQAPSAVALGETSAREAEPVDIRPDHWCRCVSGWLEPSFAEPDKPRPCLRCRPHLARRRA